MTTAAVVTAAGLGVRLGAQIPKGLVLVAGRPLVRWAVDGIAPLVDTVVVTAPAGHIDTMRSAVPDAIVVAGGDTRQSSVSAGLDALPAGTDIVLIHDAARAFQPREAMARVLDAVRAGADGAVPTVPVTDTLTSLTDGTTTPRPLGDVVDRSRVRAVQTPQVFTVDAIRAAHASAADGAATDDAQLARALGLTVVDVDGDPYGFKVTTPLDLMLAERLAMILGEDDE